MAKIEQSFPTILVVGEAGSLSHLVRILQLDGYLVLEASNWDDALRVATIHSRPIQVLAHDSGNAPNLAEILKPFRLDALRVLYVAGSPQAALAEVRRHVKPPITSSPPRRDGQAA
jgi:hypothetical protein